VSGRTNSDFEGCRRNGTSYDGNAGAKLFVGIAVRRVDLPVSQQIDACACKRKLLDLHSARVREGRVPIRRSNDCIIVSPIVPMERNDSGFTYIPFEKSVKSAAHILAENLPGKKLVSAFHTISEVKLKNITESLDSDTFVCGDDQDAVAKLNQLIAEIKGLRPLYLGSLSLSYQAEVLTPMLLNASKKNKIKHPGIKLT